MLFTSAGDAAGPRASSASPEASPDRPYFDKILEAAYMDNIKMFTLPTHSPKIIRIRVLLEIIISTILTLIVFVARPCAVVVSVASMI